MRTLATVVLSSLLAAAPALAQAQSAPVARSKAPEYDVKTETTIQGTIEDFHESKQRGDHPGLHLLVRTDIETLEVHACPVRFLSDLDFVLEKGDSVTIMGSRPGSGEIVIAREITKGQTTLILRDSNGAPVWTGR